jgi:hypothetical protein
MNTLWIYEFEDGTVLKLLDEGLSAEEVWKLAELHGKCYSVTTESIEDDC